MKRVRIAIRGAVQGVGFRPFVYRLATQLGLNGWVLNSTQGVTIEAEGMTAERLATAFRNAETPVIGRISEGLFRLDCRTILPGDGPLVYKAAKAIRAGQPR